MNQKPNALILTCEHGGNRVPRRLSRAFAPIRGMLATHRGWDPGALELAELFARRLNAPLESSEISRLVVDLNRSESHPRIFSRVTAALPPIDREALLDELYRPFRSSVRARIEKAVAAGRPVIHLSVHSFTPVMNGVRRNADIGLLYDPSRKRERALAAAWRQAIREADPGLWVRMNYPYRGTADGHTTALRKAFPDRWYAGIELEVNQAIVRRGGREWSRIQGVLADTLGRVRETEMGYTA